MNIPLIVIAGPTASGKSALALAVAQQYGGEIICADSRSVYKGMDIGTAKPSAAEQGIVPHHILDIVAPDEHFTAPDFKKRALESIADIARRGKLPIMVGGTGLYIDAVIFDYQFGVHADQVLRAQLAEKSIEELQAMCIERGIELPVNDKNRRHLVRAIELGGLIRTPRKLRPQTIVVVITTDREVLRRRITERADSMVKDGVLDEVRKLSEQYGWDNQAMTGNIYRIFRPVVEGGLDIKAALDLFIRSDMQLAKRQVTWLKRNPFVLWGSADELEGHIEHFVQQIQR